MKNHKTRLLSLLLTLCLMLSLVPAALAANVPETATEEVSIELTLNQYKRIAFGDRGEDDPLTNYRRLEGTAPAGCRLVWNRVGGAELVGTPTESCVKHVVCELTYKSGDVVLYNVTITVYDPNGATIVDPGWELTGKSYLQVDVTMEAPQIGAVPTDAVTVKQSDCTVAGVTWETMDSTFQAGVSYAVRVRLTTQGIVDFSDTVEATVNGQPAEIVSGAGTQALEIRYAFEPCGDAIPDAVVEVAAPVLGGKPAAAGQVSEKSGYTVASVNWEPQDSTFQAGVPYSVVVVLETKSDDTFFSPDAKAVINGEAAAVISGAGTQQIRISRTFPAPEEENPPVENPPEVNVPAFEDVAGDVYYTKPVKWAVEQGVTNGTSATKFSPERTCTRAQIITFLWRASGSPEPTISCPFTDVPAGSYYEKATAWAAQMGMASGDKFYPDDPCTRLMAVEFMWIQSGRPDAPAAVFGDVTSPAVNWAVKAGVTNGTSATRFSPDKTCTRAQIVTFLFRYLGD